MRALRIAVICLLGSLLAASSGAAQRPPPDSVGARIDSLAADTAGDRLLPRTAMIRSWLVPGWGQSSAGAYFRGGVFFAAQSGSWYMLLKTIARLGEARAIERERIRWVSDSLHMIIAEDPDGAGERLQDPVVFQAAVDSSQRVIGARNLVESRQQQQQDWITGTLFLTLLSGVDAFVAAHLADAPLTLESTPLPTGGVSIRLSIPFGRRPLRVSPVPASGAVWERRWPER